MSKVIFMCLKFKNFFVVISFASIFCGAQFFVAPSFSSDAEDIIKIAAVVNDDVISMYDLLSRVDIAIATSNLRDSEQLRKQITPQILKTMIDERLQIQAANSLEYTVSEEALNAAIESLEERNGNPPGSFEKFLKANKLSKETVDSQIKAEISWATVVSRRFGNTISVGEDEIDESIARIEASRGKPEYLISDIFLSVDNKSPDPKISKLADNLVSQLRGGSDFFSIARQFSQSANASVGGDLGWILEDQLPTEISNIVKQLSPNEISSPIRTYEGIFIINLRSKRLALTANPLDTKVNLTQIIVKNYNQQTSLNLELLDRLRENSKNCDDLLKNSSGKVSDLSGSLGNIEIRDLPKDLQDLILAIPIGQLSQPQIYENGYRALMVCERQETKVKLPEREKILVKIANKRLELLARRYLRNLRRQAFIDVRI